MRKHSEAGLKPQRMFLQLIGWRESRGDFCKPDVTADLKVAIFSLAL